MTPGNTTQFDSIEAAFNTLAARTTGFDLSLEFHTPTQKPKLILTMDDPDTRLAIDPIATDLDCDNDYVITTYEHGTHWLVVYTDDTNPGVRLEEADATSNTFATTAMPFERALNRVIALARSHTDTPAPVETTTPTDTDTTSDSTPNNNSSTILDTEIETGSAATLHFDGASRGNPGAAATGYVISTETADTISDGTPLGEKTNNEAEYRALIEGLETALDNNVTEIDIYGDSKLIINQVTNTWDCNSDDLKPLYNRAQALLTNFDSWTLTHVPREQNADADEAANTTLDNANC